MSESQGLRNRVSGRAGLHTEVVAAIAESEGTGSDSVDWRLADYVDPEVFDRLQRSPATWNVTVRVAGHTVQATSGGEIRVDGTVMRPHDP